MRNYVEFYSSRVNLAGNFHGFLDADEELVRARCDAFVTTFGGTKDWNGAKGYFLANKANLCALLTNWMEVRTSTSPSGSAWVFFQDGLRAKASPRDTWSLGE